MTQTNGAAERDALIRVVGLKKYYPMTKGFIIQRTTGVVKAIDGVSFSIMEGETYSLVGESGCGKTTTSRMILMVEPPTEGELYYQGESMLQFSGDDKREFRASLNAIFSKSGMKRQAAVYPH